jgi:hypothetical protein
MKVKFSLLILLFCSCKNYTYEGHVHDYDTDKPLKNVTVIINENNTKTDSLGFFCLQVNSDTADILLKKQGYATKKIHRKHNLQEKVSNKNLNNPVIYLYNRQSDFIAK